MTLIEHLAELRSRIITSVLAVTAGAVVAFWQYEPIIDWLSGPYCEIRPDAECVFLQTDPLESFGVRITVAVYTGLALAMPIVLFQVWRFITPGLHPREKRYAVPFVTAGVVLFVLGAGLAFWTVPKALDFLVSIGGDQFEQFFSGSAYLSFLVKMMVGFGIGFEFPILLVFLQIAGILSPDQLAGIRRYAIVGIVTLVAVITPSGDPISLAILSVPMYLFFEASIVIGRLLRR
ncbi:twin-arginine translocase subunit TatC [Actinomarinicola tropica]|uniref:Sec-independent protein translocase protein TatC n=2 Tax=Actinomarinicola tropica TaxID=2789776 RepID=A0A5Q2RPZ8_9ACTN|nr:twin-arginine translocase subunit TatC [Actinomarinicola tropica]